MNYRLYHICKYLKMNGSSPSIFSGFNAYRMAKRYKARFVFEVRDIWPLSLAELKNVSKMHPIYVLMRWFERYAYKRTNTVIGILLKNILGSYRNSERIMCFNTA